MIRVLHVVTYMGRGGLETMLMNYYRHIDRSKVQFDFLVHREFEADYDPVAYRRRQCYDGTIKSRRKVI